MQHRGVNVVLALTDRLIEKSWHLRQQTLGPLYFQVWADGWPLYSGPVLTSGAPAVPINVNVSGYQWLSLVVTNGTYMAQAWQVPCDHADWANAQLTCTK